MIDFVSFNPENPVMFFFPIKKTRKAEKVITFDISVLTWNTEGVPEHT